MRARLPARVVALHAATPRAFDADGQAQGFDFRSLVAGGVCNGARSTQQRFELCLKWANLRRAAPGEEDIDFELAVDKAANDQIAAVIGMK